ncbi:general negative regulator of transcription subunit 5 [Lecanora helva]
MAQRKLQQEIDKTFKKVAEGIQTFESIFDKIQQATNASQKDKLEDALKREIKKLQRHRDQIKTWAAGNEIKDKKPLMEQRKAIENQMEKFKAVEKEMKTKAFSKEGLQATAKLDPAEKAKLESCQFLANMVEELERQVESLEAEEETLQATVKKGKKDTSKADRLSEISRTLERHKYHQGKLELLLRSLENGNVETEQVQDLEESIKYYVEENGAVDFNEDDTIYDDLNLEEDEGAFGLNNENDRVSSQDAQSIQDDLPDTAEGRGSIAGGKPKSTSVSEPQGANARRPSNQLKSPLPALATLHTPTAANTNGTANNAMKPAPLPTRAPGETLKYASAAAAAAASDKGTVGIAPLPPPPSATAAPTPSAPPGLSALPPTQKSSATTSPSAAPSLPASSGPTPAQKPAVPAAVSTEDSMNAQTQPKSPTRSHTSPSAPPINTRSDPPSTTADMSSHSRTPSTTKIPPPTQAPIKDTALPAPIETQSTHIQSKPAANEQPNGESAKQEEAESVYHLPPGLQDLLQSFEVTRNRAPAWDSPAVRRLLAASYDDGPSYLDTEKPRYYQPDTKYNTPPYYPQEPYGISDDPNLYKRIDTDTLFYIFYYRQNSYQQYLAAKALKSQSWRFHKQYQTWFQRHEEPKTITEEYEQGTYRFFDYESTW